MRPSVLAICLALLTFAQLRSAWLRLRGPSGAGPPHARREASTIEVPGGLACIEGAHGGRLGVAHRLLTGGVIDPASMSVRDWEALPQVGPHRASALASAFAAAPAGGLRQTLARVRLPRVVHGDLERRLGLDEASPHDICSLGSWPTTSSGYDRPR